MRKDLRADAPKPGTERRSRTGRVSTIGVHLEAHSLFVESCQQGDAAKLRNCQLDNLRLNLLEDAASSTCLRDPHRQEQTKFKRWKTCQVSLFRS